MSLWAGFLLLGVVGAGWYVFTRVTAASLWLAGYLDDLDRKRLIDSHVAACEPAGLTDEDLVGADLDECDERFLVWQRGQLGDAFDWTATEVADALLSIRSLTVFYGIHWEAA